MLRPAAGCQPAVLSCSNTAAGCQPASLGSSFGAQGSLRAASPHCLEARGAQRPLRAATPAPLGSSFHAQAPLRAPSLLRSALLVGAQRPLSPRRLEAAFMLKGRCELPAGTAWKQLWCSRAASSCQPAPLGSSFGAQKPLQALSLHRLFTALALKSRCRLPDRTAWKQLSCSRPLRAASPHRLKAALVLKGFSFELPPA